MKPNFTITLAAHELDLVANALAQRPWAEVNTLLANIKGQIDQQQTSADPQIGQMAPPQASNGVDRHAN